MIILDFLFDFGIFAFLGLYLYKLRKNMSLVLILTMLMVYYFFINIAMYTGVLAFMQIASFINLAIIVASIILLLMRLFQKDENNLVLLVLITMGIFMVIFGTRDVTIRNVVINFKNITNGFAILILGYIGFKEADKQEIKDVFAIFTILLIYIGLRQFVFNTGIYISFRDQKYYEIFYLGGKLTSSNLGNIIRYWGTAADFQENYFTWTAIFIITFIYYFREKKYSGLIAASFGYLLLNMPNLERTNFIMAALAISPFILSSPMLLGIIGGGIGLATIAILASPSLSSLFSIQFTRLLDVFGIATNIGASGTVNSRYEFWPKHIKIIQENFLVGLGFEKFVPSFSGKVAGHIGSPHNEYFLLAESLGVIVGGICIVMMIFFKIYSVNKVYKKLSIDCVIAIILFFLMLVLNSMLNYSFFVSAVKFNLLVPAFFLALAQRQNLSEGDKIADISKAIQRQDENCK